jgi:selenide,water dikinase
MAEPRFAARQEGQLFTLVRLGSSSGADRSEERILPAMVGEARLTRFSHGAGCACKLGPADLATLMGLVGPIAHPPEVLVSERTGDDAAVWALPDGSALVATIDVFTPVVDDATDWGRIAAANALSDVYAMGGTPRLALNMAGWPESELPIELLADVLRGAREIAQAAGVAVVGGHTITTEREPLYGMVAIGFVDPARMIRNAAAEPGMSLFLTKPLGVGILTTAVKRDLATDAQVRAAVTTMTTLNAAAARAAAAASVRAGTDVTGFGLLGHLRKLLEASGAAATVDAGAVQLLEGVKDLAMRDVVPGGTKRNHAWLQATTDWGRLTTPEQLVLADAQTSGGLLLATHDPAGLAGALHDEGVSHAVIGAVTTGEPGRIRIDGRLRW